MIFLYERTSSQHAMVSPSSVKRVTFTGSFARSDDATHSTTASGLTVWRNRHLSVFSSVPKRGGYDVSEMISGAGSPCGVCSTPVRQRRFISFTQDAYEISRFALRHSERGRSRNPGMS